MDERAVRAFWPAHPCGDAQLSGLYDAFSGDLDPFYTEYARTNRSIASEPASLPWTAVREAARSERARPPVLG